MSHKKGVHVAPLGNKTAKPIRFWSVGLVARNQTNVQAAQVELIALSLRCQRLTELDRILQPAAVGVGCQIGVQGINRIGTTGIIPGFAL